MSEFRYDPIKRTWVILAAQRGQRPSHYQSDTQTVLEPKTCSFCLGSEAMTPPEVYALRSPGTEPDGPGWRVRVVPNKYPALSTDHPFEPLCEGIHCRARGFGIHEVVIENSTRNRQMADMDHVEIAEVLMVLRSRMQSHHKDGRFKAVIIFKNHGKEAGASLVHSHTQIMALPFIPDTVDFQFQSFMKHRELQDRCLVCEMLEKESGDRARVVVEDGGYTVLAPFAAASPYQLHIVPKAHHHDFSMSSDENLNELAPVLGETLKRLRSVLGEHPWNMVWHNAPVDPEGGTDFTAYHWFIEITPRLTNPAGFEMGSGFSINTVAPEECAALLRAQCAGRGAQEKPSDWMTKRPSD